MNRGELLRAVPDDARWTTRLGHFADAAERVAGQSLPDYPALWKWSVENLDAFWGLASRETGLIWDTEPEYFIRDETMPGTTWCPGGLLNYAQNCLRFTGNQPAIISHSQTRSPVTLSRDELRDQVARCAAGLRRLGVGKGDRVAAYLPNIAETVVAFLATASIGATWASCAPEFGARSVIDRLGQFQPKVLFTVDGYRFGAKDIGRGSEVAAIRKALADKGLQHVVLLPYLDPSTATRTVPDATSWAELLAEPGELTFEPVEFGHPLYVLFSSGTTGLPKPIVHGHGGITLEHLKVVALQVDLREDDVFFWFSTTGWMMWNLWVSGLLTGTALLAFDGNPGYPDLSALWKLADETGVTFFGTGAPFLMACRKAGVTPREVADTSRIRGVGSTAAPLPLDGFTWVYDAIGQPDADPPLILDSLSGGTDICSAFVGGSPLSPIRAGEISGRYLGVDAQAFNDAGEPVIGEVGELVITRPTPSMPVSLLGDDDGSRYRSSYFDTYDGVWQHGDWVTFFEDGACVISGRSDATLNRGGVRLGTSEFYAVVEELDEVADSLVVHLEDDEGGSGRLLLFVVPTDASADQESMAKLVAKQLRDNLSPRHVPDELHLVPAVPRTLSGKKLEVPVKKMLRGASVDTVASKESLANPESLETYRKIAQSRA